MTIETHNWSSSAHQELYKIVRDEIFSIVNQVDARVKNFEIQFLKEAAKFVGYFKSLTNEADASFTKHKSLELEIERLLKAVVSQDIMIIVQNESVVDTSDLHTELEPYKDMQQKIERLQAQLGDLKGKCKDTSCVSDTQNPLSQKLENENVELEFQVLNYARENAHLKATYKNLFDSIYVSLAQIKTIINSLQNELQSTIYKNAKLRTQLFKKVSNQKDNTHDTSANTKFAKQPIMENLPKVGETNALSKPVTSNSVSTPQESKGVNYDKVIAPGMFRINHFKTSREENHVPNTVSASNRTKPISVSQPPVITKKDPKVTKPKKVESHKSLAIPKPRKSRLLLRWSPTGRLFDQEGKIVDSSESDSQSDCVNDDNACTSNSLEPKIKRFLNSTSLLDRNDLVSCLPKFKYHKEHLCPSCEQGKSKRASHPPKPVPNSRQRLHLLHMDLCGPMRIASINGKRYVLVIVDDYSRYTWVHFLRYKDEAPAVIITFLKRITVLLQSPVIIIRTDNDTEFKNQVIKEYFVTVGISHQMSSVRTPQQNEVVKRQNQTLAEAARTMLIFSRASLFLWVEAIATAIYNRRTKKIIETMNVSFDELSAMAFEQRSSKPGLQSMTSRQISSGLDLTYAPSTITMQQPSKGELDLLFEAMYDDYIGGQPSATGRTVPPAQEPQVRQSSTASTTIADTAPIPTNSSSLATNIPVTSQDVDELNSNAMVDGNTFVNPFANSSTSADASSSSQNMDPSNMHTFYQPYPHKFQWI
nr:putative ribonuclease H-like domain-containing protein [Tanacetum cinerariifolium]